MNEPATHWLKARIPEHVGNVVEIGGRDTSGRIHSGGGVRSLFYLANSFISVDIKDGEGVDVVADFSQWALEQPSPIADVVIAVDVFQHVHNWPLMVSSAKSILHAGGKLFVTCATEPKPARSNENFSVIPKNEFYRNVSPASLSLIVKNLFTSFVLEVPGDGYLYLAASL